MSKVRYQVTALITDKRGRVISIAQNSYVKSHPFQARLAEQMGEPHKIYLHAEVHAILKCQDLSKAHRIFISRFDSTGNPVNAKPCKICAEAIRKAGIKIVEHT